MSHYEETDHQLCNQGQGFSELERHILNDFQHGFPLTPTPFADIADSLGTSEADVLEAVRSLSERGVISRVGAVLSPNRAGASTLAAMAVPAGRLEQVAELINAFVEVNHNYEREHDYNLWFVVTAEDEARLQAVLAEMERQTGLAVLNLPMLKDYHIDLGFELQWR